MYIYECTFLFLYMFVNIFVWLCSIKLKRNGIDPYVWCVYVWCMYVWCMCVVFMYCMWCVCDVCVCGVDVCRGMCVVVNVCGVCV